MHLCASLWVSLGAVPYTRHNVAVSVFLDRSGLYRVSILGCNCFSPLVHGDREGSSRYEGRMGGNHPRARWFQFTCREPVAGAVVSFSAAVGARGQTRRSGRRWWRSCRPAPSNGEKQIRYRHGEPRSPFSLRCGRLKVVSDAASALTKEGSAPPISASQPSGHD